MAPVLGGSPFQWRIAMGKALSDFLLNIHSATMAVPAEEFQKRMLSTLGERIPFDFAIWGVGAGVQRNLHTVTVIHQIASLFDTWEPVKTEDKYADLVINNTGRTCSLDQIPHFRQTRAFHEHWRLYDAHQMISTMEADPQTGLYLFVTLARDHPRRPFTPEEVQFKNLVAHHVFLAARHNDQHYLNGFRTPVALVDERGRLHSAVADFQALATAEWGPDARRRLPLTATRALWQFGEYRGRSIKLKSEAAGHRLVVSAQPRVVSELSEREREVAWAYVSGKSYKEVASALCISPATVRTHLAHVYRKLNLKDKGALALWLKEYD